MTIKRKIGFGLIGAIALMIMFGPGPGPASPEPGCADHLSYKQSIKDQINELCTLGMPRQKAIDALAVVYRDPRINPDKAVAIVRTAAGIAAMNADPLRYAK